MTNKEFVDAAKNIVCLNTVYASGTFGQKFSEGFLEQKAKQYPKFYTEANKNFIRTRAKEGTLYMFDCVGLIKGIIWSFPNMKYASGKLADVSDAGLWNIYCNDKSSDMSFIFPGEIMHMTGHVGIYIGDDKVIEATNRWSRNVLVSSINKDDKYFRQWEAHGKLSILTYENMIIPAPAESDKMFYVVKPGDTLWSISQMYGTSWEILARKNNIKNPDLIFPGQHIII